MHDYPSLIRLCQAREQEEQVRGIETGPMVLDRLTGRLEKDFYPKYQELAWQFSRRLKPVNSVTEFDEFHRSFVQGFRDTIKSRSGTTISYGEAQQPVNIFLKEYVEKSNILDKPTSGYLRPFLHVTLDGVIMYYLQSFFRDDYLNYIAPFDTACGYLGTSKITPYQQKDLSHSQLNQMMFFDYKVYSAWQGWFRRIFPARPVLLDTVWSIARRTLVSGIGSDSRQEPTSENLIQYMLRFFSPDRT